MIGAITVAWYRIDTKLRLSSLLDPGLWALPMVTWSCLIFLSELVPTLTFMKRSLAARLPSKTMCVLLFPVSLGELVFWGWWNVHLWKPLCYFVAILHLFSQSLSIVLRCGGQLLNITFSFLSTGVFGGQAWSRSEFFVVRSSTSSGWAYSMLHKINLNSNHCLFSQLPSASTRVRHSRAAAAAYLLKFEVSRCRTAQFARQTCYLTQREQSSDV